MKKEIFKALMKRIAEHYSITHEEMFGPSVKHHITGARNTLVAASRHKGIPNYEVLRFFEEQGFKLQSGQMLHYVRSFENRAEKDSDLRDFFYNDLLI